MKPTSQPRRRRFNRLNLEALEDRTLLSTFMVDRLTDTGEGSGLAGDLRYCITQATSGQDTIDFGVTGTINLTKALPDLTSSVSIDGPGADLLTVRRDTGPGYRFGIFKVGGSAAVGISGLTIANGFNDFDGRGGGIFNSGTLTVDGTTLSGNEAEGGGGIYNLGTLTVSNSTFSGNGAQEGGAIFNAGTLTVSYSTFSGNVADDGSGGAINSGYINSGGTVTVTNSTLSGNGASYIGSAISIFSGSLKLSASTILGNRGGSGGSRDSALFLGGETATISNSTISGNRSAGGGTILSFGTVTISNSTISGNSAGGIGSAGGIRNSGTLTVSNCTVSGNTDGDINSAGGIYNTGTLTVSNCTISGNTYDFSGNPRYWTAGGIANVAVSDRDATVTLLNSTIANNTAISNNPTGSQLYSGHDIIRQGAGVATIQLRNTIISGDGGRPNFFADVGGTFVSQGHNLSNDDGSGFLTGPGDLINADPLLGPLQDNGGPTQTMALLPGSPAVDAGDNTAAPDFDQRGPGFPRIVGGVIDIGAFEVQPGPASHFKVSAPAHVTSNTPFDVTVVALDVYGHTAVGYRGTVTFGSTDPDPGVLLPADYTFTADDQGVHTFVGGFILITPGDQTLTATDTSDNSITGSATVTVDPGPVVPPGGGGLPIFCGMNSFLPTNTIAYEIIPEQ